MSNKLPQASWDTRSKYKYGTYLNLKVINVNQLKRVGDIFKETLLKEVEAKNQGRFVYATIYQPDDEFDPNDTTTIYLAGVAGYVADTYEEHFKFWDYITLNLFNGQYRL
jgi:hypothetical protein